MKLLKFVVLALVVVGANVSLSAEMLKAKKIGTQDDAKKALSALKEVFAAYSTGDVTTIREHLDFKMIGYQKLLDGVVQEANLCKQIRINLLNTQVQAAPDLVVIQTNWEKRCLLVPNLSPRYFTGHSTFLMQMGGDGTWDVTGISGASPISPSIVPGGR